MPFDLDAPGLKLRRNPGGTFRLGWFATYQAVMAVGFRPSVVRLPYSPDDPPTASGSSRLVSSH